MSSCRSSSTSKINMRNKSQGKIDYQNKSGELLKFDKLQKSDQIRTSLTDNRINNKEDIVWQERIKQVMELTRRSEDEVIMALHDSDGDLNRAVNDLLEGVSSEWEIKKKKARQSGGTKQNIGQSGITDSNVEWEGKHYLYKEGSLRIRGRGNHRGWRRRENKENETNIEDIKSDVTYGISRRGRAISGRSGRGGRGAGRGLGPRTFASRKELTASRNVSNFTRPIETWNGDEEQTSNCNEIKMDSWIVDGSEEWDNEEYTGSLADSKVFTPSILSSEATNISDTNKYEEIISNKSLQPANSIVHLAQRSSKQRPRVPPPSKIPSSAVEMPGDSISFLDVQFGALEFGSDSNLNDTSSHDKFITSGNNLCISNIDSTSFTTKAVENSISSINQDVIQTSSSQKFSTTTKMLHSVNQACMTNDHSLNCQNVFKSRSSGTDCIDTKKQDTIPATSLCSSSFNKSVTYQSSKTPYSTSVAANNYSTYSCTSQSNETSFNCSATTSSSTKNFPSVTPVPQTGYNSYTQSSISTYNQVSSSSATVSVINIPTSATSQIYQPSTGFTTASIAPYQTHSVSTNSLSNTSSYMCAGYQSSATFHSTTQSYQTSNPTFVTSLCQGSSVYSNATQSVYSNSYTTYGSQNQTGPQNHKPNSNKELQFDNNVTSATTPLITEVPTLGITTASGNTSQTKTTGITANTKSTVSGSINNASNISGSTNAANITPILGHQYIMGQSVPYAAFQQPHMYSYEDLQLIQQRMPHMPTTGYYDATVGYQTTGPVTSLCNSRSDNISGVQTVQGVQAVQGQYTSISDGRFTRADSDTSPVSSNISPQSATQHQQPLLNPIPPGYAYFYGGGIMPAGGFQYGTPAIYPQIATAGTANSTSTGYNTKPGSYVSTYASGTTYDSLTNSGASGDYKASNATYVSQTGKNGPSNANTNTAGASTDINATMYSKGHVAINKAYEKQTFHSATPPPFSLTNNQNANVISGYGTHLFIPTVPHQLHQPLHQDSGNTAGQRATANSQSKTQVKSGYSTSYWAGSN